MRVEESLDPSGTCQDEVSRRLVGAAYELIARRYLLARHQIGAAILDADGGVHLGLHLDAMVGRAAICAEAVALGTARMATHTALVAVAAVRFPKPTEDGPARIVPPCGLCRELLLDHAPDLSVVLTGRCVALADLLPDKYVGTKWPTTASDCPERSVMDFRTPEVDKLAAEVIPEEFFELSAEKARDVYFADTRMLDGKQLAHNRYRTNPRSLIDHLVEQLELSGTETLLDIGCGNGFVLEHLRPHLADGHIVGLDIAPGVLRAAEARLAGVATPCEWVEGSADDLSLFGDHAFERVIATYMMHYVPDIDRCLAEVRRVLRPGGRFVLTTDRTDSMVEMYEMHFAVLRDMDAPKRLFKATPKARISLANGEEYLRRHFANVELRTWQDQLRFASAEAFMAFYSAHNYCCAASEPGDLGENFFEELHTRARARVEDVIARDGYFALTKFTGSFICS
ncbi:methyltransferase domain-containing protein [Microbispora sp. NPDC049125]|uniref:methyltransferase domain-containing protein n=1 Tax=Microbispora sp. NPDC049125 TaxID=3154929 RepID=UPI0034654A64